MFPYIPITEKQEEEMLGIIGVQSVSELFDDIPESIRLNRELRLDKSLSEYSVERHMHKLGKRNRSTDELVCFLGAGTYDHYIPAVVPHLAGRSEFYTAYTPYQPEISQGTLQCIFEYQTMICELTDMEASNASMYDGATAAAEAVMIAADGKRGTKLLISETVHPEVIEVVKTYMKFRNIEVEFVPACKDVTDKAILKDMLTKEHLAVLVQSPNFFGNIEDLEGIPELAKAQKALSVVYTEPFALSILKTPGAYGFDIAVGEAQSFGNAMNYGGPHLGFMAVSKKNMRKLPGRIAGESVDENGERAYVLTLQAREQHIRREKASSNICSNQALNALSATIYMSAMGKEGLLQVAKDSHTRAVYLKEKLIETGVFEPISEAPIFKEFALKSKIDLDLLTSKLLENGILGGVDLSHYYTDRSDQLLISVTEKRTKEEMDAYVQVVEGLK